MVLNPLESHAQKQITVSVAGGKELLQGGVYASDNSDNIYQAYYRGEKELIVSKFDACGQLKWSTSLDLFQKAGAKWAYENHLAFRIVAGPEGWIYVITGQQAINPTYPVDYRLIIQCLNPLGHPEMD